MATTISNGANYPNGIILSTQAQNPVTVTSAAVISNPGGDALTGVNFAFDVHNYGNLAGNSDSSGVDLTAGGSVVNGSTSARTATISGGNGVLINRLPGTVQNQGTIVAAAGGGGGGVFLTAGGSVNNGTGALIGGYTGVFLGRYGTVVNDGSIGGTGAGVGYGLFLNGGGSVSNYGTITGPNAGILSLDSGQISNSGRIVGNVGIVASGTVTNYGTIVGYGGTALRLGAGDDRVNLSATGVFAGAVDGGGGANTLLLQSGAPGTITGLGSNFRSFGAVVVATGADWTLAGSNVIGSGTILGDGGTLRNVGSLQNAGIIQYSSGVLVGGGTYGYSGTLSHTTFRNAAAGPATNVLAGGTAFNLANSGFLSNSGSISVGVYQSGGTLVNLTSGYISASYAAVYASAVATQIYNSGQIVATGTSGSGITLTGGGTISNDSGAYISGPSYGIRLTGTAATAIRNLGTVRGNYGIYSSTGLDETIGNGGRIVGNSTSVRLGSGNDRVIAYAGAQFSGTVDAGSGTNVLELSGATGTFSGLGSQYLGFGAIIVDAGATWQLIGDNDLVTGTGSLDAVGLIDYGSLGITGTLGIPNASTLIVVGNTYGPGGYLNVSSGSQISSYHMAVYTSTGPVGITNVGLIAATGSAASAIQLQAGGAILNGVSGTISGTYAGIRLGGTSVAVPNAYYVPATIVNNGLIVGSVAVSALAGSSTDQTVVNAGTLTGTAGTAVQFSDGNDRMVLVPGGVLNGNVLGGSGSNTLELAPSGTYGSYGVLSGIGTQYQSFQTITVDQGASWRINSAETIQTGGTGGAATLLTYGTLINTAALYQATGSQIVNSGVLINSGTNGRINGSVTLAAGGYLGNGSGARILGTGNEIVATGLATVSNYGTISTTGTTSAALLMQGGATINNAGTISGGAQGVRLDDTSQFLLTSATSAAIGAPITTTYYGAARTITNFGLIVGAVGIYGYAAATTTATTVTNFGTISATGTSGIAVQLGNGNDEMGIAPLSVLNGTVQGGGGIDTLRLLNTGTTTGTLSGLGTTKFLSFEALAIDAGATWQIGSNNSIAGIVSVTGDGTLVNPTANTLQTAGTGTSYVIAPGSFVNQGTVTIGANDTVIFRTTLDPVAPGAAGTINLAASGVVEFNGLVDPTQTIIVSNGADRVKLDTPMQFQGTISGFGSDDIIDLVGIAADQAAYAGGVLTVTSQGSTVASIHLAGGSYAGRGFTTSSDGAGGTQIVFTPDLYSFVYVYGDNRDYYYGSVSAAGGLYVPGQIVRPASADQSGNIGYYQIIADNGTTALTPGTVYVSDYYIGINGGYYTPYFYSRNLASGSLGLGTEFDYLAPGGNATSYFGNIAGPGSSTMRPFYEASREPQAAVPTDYQFVYVYGNNTDYYYGIVSASAGTYSINQIITDANPDQTGSRGHYQILSNLRAASAPVGTVQVTDYYSAANGRYYTPYFHSQGQADGGAGLGTEFDYLNLSGNYTSYFGNFNGSGSSTAYPYYIGR